MIPGLLVYLTHPHVDCWQFKPHHQARLEAVTPGRPITVVQNSRDFLKALPQAEAVCVWYFKQEWWERASRLKLLSTPAAGMDWIELPATEPQTEIWFGAFHGGMMAESVLGAALYFLKGFSLSATLQKEKQWARTRISNQIGTLQNARVTLYGFGRIGERIGRVFKALGARITGIRRQSGARPDYFGEADRVLTPDALPKVLPETDHLIMTLPGGPETDGAMGFEQFDLLPGPTFFYNVGRGNPYRENDLIWALENHKIRAAYLDVFATEPLPETSPLWRMENVLIQPHLSAAGPQYLDLYVDELIGRITARGGF